MFCADASRNFGKRARPGGDEACSLRADPARAGEAWRLLRAIYSSRRVELKYLIGARSLSTYYCRSQLRWKKPKAKIPLGAVASAKNTHAVEALPVLEPGSDYGYGPRRIVLCGQNS